MNWGAVLKSAKTLSWICIEAKHYIAASLRSGREYLSTTIKGTGEAELGEIHCRRSAVNNMQEAYLAAGAFATATFRPSR